MRISFLNLLLLSILISCASSKEVKLEKQFSEYLYNFQNERFDLSTMYITEDYFEFVSKEMLIEILNRTYSDSAKRESNIINLKIIGINDPVYIDETYYAQITYSGANQLRYIDDKKIDESDQDYLTRMNKVKKGMQGAFGTNNVTYDENTEIFQITFEQSAYGILKKADKNWKFLIHDEGQLNTIKKLIPNELLIQD